MNFENTTGLLVGISTSVLLLIAGHWFPWHVMLSMDRIPAYIYGVSCILIGFTIWQGSSQNWDVVLGLALLIACSGASVMFSYAIDSIARQRAQVDIACKVLEEDAKKGM
jgi:hypothetical protein